MSAVLKPEKIETIYDHGATIEELNQLFYGNPETPEDYLLGLSNDSLLVDIVRLYQLRGQADTANRYASLIKDSSIQAEFATKGCCVAHA